MNCSDFEIWVMATPPPIMGLFILFMIALIVWGLVFRLRNDDDH